MPNRDKFFSPESGQRYLALTVFDHVPSSGSGELIDPDEAKSAIDHACDLLVQDGYTVEEADLISGIAIHTVRRAKQAIDKVTPEDFHG